MKEKNGKLCNEGAHCKIVKHLGFSAEALVAGTRLRCAVYDLTTAVEWVGGHGKNGCSFCVPWDFNIQSA